MDSKIHERISRSLENDADIQSKSANALLKEEQARNLRSKTDLLDQEFARKQNGQDNEDYAAREAIKVQAKKSQEEHKALLELEKDRISNSSYGQNPETYNPQQGESYGL